MDDWVEINLDEAHVKRERAKARELRKTSYFRNLLARGICHYCGGKFAASELTIDHVVPISRGGRSTRGNMVVACKECNARKKFLTPAEMVMREEEASRPTPESGEKL